MICHLTVVVSLEHPRGAIFVSIQIASGILTIGLDRNKTIEWWNGASGLPITTIQKEGHMHQSYLQKYNFLRKSHHSIPIGLCVGVVALLLSIIVSGGEVRAISACGSTPAPAPDKLHFPEGYDYSSEFPICDVIPVLTDPITVTPSLSLSIDGKMAVSDQIVAGREDTNYSSHTVTVKAEHITDYALNLSGVSISGPTALTGADNITGSTLGENSWGYAWGETSITDTNLTYNSTASTRLTGDKISEGKVDFSRKLVFATKFNNQAESGTYHVSATLSAVATPIAVTTYVPWDNLVYMQDMNASACAEAPMGVEKTLKDIRDDNTYTVAKLSDGKCWMTQNLRITGNSFAAKMNKAATAPDGLTCYDSDLGEACAKETGGLESFAMPESALWTDTSYTAPHVYYDNDTTYGAYYNWNAATAGSGTDKVESGNAEYSICPKGWRLPIGGVGTTNEFATMSGIVSSVSKDTNYWNSAKDLSFSGDTLIVNGSTWFAAGYIVDGLPTHVGFSGNYWSSTAIDTNTVYSFVFFGEYFGPVETRGKHVGFSVRCVAR